MRCLRSPKGYPLANGIDGADYSRLIALIGP